MIPSKPFKLPILKRPYEKSADSSQIRQNDPSRKKRRLSPTQDDGGGAQDLASANEAKEASYFPQKTSHHAPVKPAITLEDSSPFVHETTTPDPEGQTRAYYNVLWRNFKVKKHKVWDGDGILCVVNGYATLHDADGVRLGRTPCNVPLLPDATLSVGGREIQIESIKSKAELSSHKVALDDGCKPKVKEIDERLRTNVKFNTIVKGQAKSKPMSEELVRTVPTPVRSVTSSFKNPLKDSTTLPPTNSGLPVPRHDPQAPGALVMQQPVTIPTGKQIVDVVVDPLLSKRLREHQRAGVKFLYECVMGMRPFAGDGAILADEMGLGKTLQVITLLWTLLKQNPIHGDGPVIKKALIVCPVTLIKNWKKEFRKWLGLERVGVFVLEDKKTRLTDFTMGRSYNIMIVGYEKLRTIQNDLQKGAGIDIVIADEGHRLKTAQNKSAQAIKSLSTSRKIILSGTPLQNDLSEFYFMVDFVNPGLLGKVNVFKREFEMPILKSRQPGASGYEIDKGEERSEELANLTTLFILRRTAEILADHLPEKTEYILFCRPTSTQASVYRTLITSSIFSALLNAPEASLQLIGILKKLCNSPSLLRLSDASESGDNNLLASLLSSVPPSLLKSPGGSGKLQVLDGLLYHIRNTTDEKVVIVSHYTATLNILENLLCSLGYSFLRIDGSTSPSKRQDLVDRFNRTDHQTCFAFLLSAKSGGVGLNLTGASRLVLFDNDWNPSTDLQAMARIHRDGQKNPCRIYRLLTKGALDEKIYQRQLTKLSLADSVVDNKVSSSTFTREELRDLFRLDEAESCQTHELLGCPCGGTGLVEANPLDQLARLGTATSLRNVSLAKESQTEAEDEMESDEPRPKEKLQRSLSRYKHFSTAKLLANPALHEYFYADDAKEIDVHEADESLASAADIILQDEVLVNSLRDSENRIEYLFVKSGP